MKQASSSLPPTTLMGQFRRHLPAYLMGLLLLAVYHVAQYYFNVELSDAIDAATQGKKEAALRGGALLVALALAALLVRIFSRVVVFNAGRRAEYELRGRLLRKLQTLDSAFYQQMSPGEIMSRATNDLTQVRLLLGFAVLNLVNTVFGLIGALAFALSISVKLTLASLAPLPLLLLVTSSFASRMYVRQKENQESLGELSDFVQSSISGSRIVRSFHLDAEESEKFAQKNQSYLDKSLALAKLRGSMGPVMQAITSIGILIVFWYGGMIFMRGDISEGNFVSFFRALGQLTWPLMAVGFLVGMFQRGRAGYVRLRQIFDAQPVICDGQEAPPKEPAGALSVRNLHFSYDDHEVLADLSFDLAPGGSVAFVGRTGSGKSTLAQLLPRLLDCPRGSVFLDGQDICDLPLDYLRHVVGYAAQSPFLFSTTVGQNIGLALDDQYGQAARLTIREAAKRAHILDELLALPDGLETVVGERGVQLSGGQKQRVALASAFVLSPRVLVLDDPLSAVDAKTERGILEAIDEQMRERAVVLITHRVAAASRCEKIYVLDEGRIVESGTHAELEKSGGIYASFAREQRLESELSRLADASSFEPLDAGGAADTAGETSASGEVPS